MSFEDPTDTTEAHERRVTRCRACHARIVFLETEAGKRMPATHPVRLDGMPNRPLSAYTVEVVPGGIVL